MSENNPASIRLDMTLEIEDDLVIAMEGEMRRLGIATHSEYVQMLIREDGKTRDSSEHS